MSERFTIDNGDDEGPRDAVWASDYDALVQQLAATENGFNNACKERDALKKSLGEMVAVNQHHCGMLSQGVADLAAARAELAEAKHQFQNFHRLLCERFGYGHDPVDWQRDQLSLIEWIDEDYIRPWQVARAELEAYHGDMDIQAAELARTEQQLADCREASEAMSRVDAAEKIDEAQMAAVTLSLKLGTAETRIRELEAANERLLSLVCQWSESCTGRHGSQTQCVESCSPSSDAGEPSDAKEGT